MLLSPEQDTSSTVRDISQSDKRMKSILEAIHTIQKSIEYLWDLTESLAEEVEENLEARK